MAENKKGYIMALMPPTRNERIDEFRVIKGETENLLDIEIPGNPNLLPQVLIHTDGSCFNKVDGSYSKNSGGFAAVIQSGKKLKSFTAADFPKKHFGDNLQILYGGSREETSAALMEITAVVESLKTQTRPSRIHIATDNQALVLKFFSNPVGLMKEYEEKNDSKSKEMVKMMKELLFVVDTFGHEVTAQYTPAHKDVHSNNLADALANKARCSDMTNIVYYKGSRVEVNINFTLEAHNLNDKTKEVLRSDLQRINTYLGRLDKDKQGLCDINVELVGYGRHSYIHIEAKGLTIDHRLATLESAINKVGAKYKCLSLADRVKMFETLSKTQDYSINILHSDGNDAVEIETVERIDNYVSDEQKNHNSRVNERRKGKFEGFFNRSLIKRPEAKTESIARSLESKCECLALN